MRHGKEGETTGLEAGTPQAAPGLRGMVRDWLVFHGYGGLYRDCSDEGPDRACGCSIKDLMPCGSPGPGCSAAYGYSCIPCSEEGCPNRVHNVKRSFHTDKGHCPLAGKEGER